MARKRIERMPDRFDMLAVYNAECARGIAHTSYWVAQMAALQADYDRWLRRDDPPEDDPGDAEAQRIADVFDEARAEMDRGL